ncbi:MAG: hypothetical protein IKH92_11135 [Clostridiales bacterium]|nr:hypothetical protein [Clostridiales bacterium]
MKKTIKAVAVLLSVMAVAQCFCGCGKKTEGTTSSSASSEAGQVAGGGSKINCDGMSIAVECATIRFL